MTSVISVLSRTPNLLKELEKVLPNVVFHETKTPDSQFTQSSIVIGDYDLIGPHLYNLPNLKWVQGTWAGVERLMPFIKRENPPDFPITRFSGRHFGCLMSEYVVANIVNNERNLFDVRENQLVSKWFRKGKIANHRAIFDLSIGLMGLGTIGNRIGQTLHFMGAEIYGYGRKPQLSDYEQSSYISRYFTKNSLPELLKNCDYLINVLPNTADTVGLLNGDILENCKERGTVFINIGRGTIISEESLMNALEKKWISAAIIDVIEKEPLRKESPLWTLPQVFLTPHVSGMSRAKDIAAQFRENLKLFQENLPLPNAVDYEKGY